MIRIQVTIRNGLPLPQPFSAEFNELGGNIGRADGNALVLPDPERHISRTHASVAFRAGGYVIRDLGTATSVYVNGQPLGNGQEAPIAPSDEIRIGGYTMQVLSESPTTPKQGLGPVTPAAAPATPPQNAPLSKGTAAAVKPMDNLFAVPATPSDIIPLDFDPFADFAPIATPRLPDELDLGLEATAPNQNIDELFDLSSKASTDPFGPGNPLAEPLNQPNAGASVDPLVALGAASTPTPTARPTQRDDVHELRSAYRPPKAKPDIAMQTASVATSPAEEIYKPPQAPAEPGIKPPTPSEPYGMVLSWEDAEPGKNDGEIKTVIVPSPKHESDRRQVNRRKIEQEVTVSPATGVSAFASERTEVAPVAPSSTPAMPTVETLPHPESRDELLRAFLAGAGVPNLDIPGGLTPQAMNLFGQLLRESTQGTLDLLLARTLTKREVRAEMTMIVVRENNPLKFSPSVEVALSHLLAPQGHGFMMPLQAVKDACDDLRSHQFGFMAGMRAALVGVLERFNPEQLEKRLAQKTVIDLLLSMNRKAKLWDLFSERYSGISKEAEDDFHALFGKEFLRAYEAQIARLEQDDESTKR